MHIFEIKYSRGRTVQPRAYESDRVDVELTAQLVEGEDVDAALTRLRGLALTEVGRGKTTETVEVRKTASETVSEAGGTEPAAETATEEPKAAKKTRKKKAAPAETAAAPVREATGDIQDEELVAESAKAAATITPPGVKDIMTDFGVPRLSVIAQDKRSDFIAKLHAAVAARIEANKADDNDIPL